MNTSYTEFPSGRVLCCMRHDTGAIVCASDEAYGPFVVRAQEALPKAREIQNAMQCLNTVEAGIIIAEVV